MIAGAGFFDKLRHDQQVMSFFLARQKGFEPPTPALGVWRDQCRTERT